MEWGRKRASVSSMKRVLLCCDLVVTLKLNSFSNRLWLVESRQVLKCPLGVGWTLGPFRLIYPQDPETDSSWLVGFERAFDGGLAKMGSAQHTQARYPFALLIKVTLFPESSQGPVLYNFMYLNPLSPVPYGLGSAFSTLLSSLPSHYHQVRESWGPNPLYWDKSALISLLLCHRLCYPGALVAAWWKALYKQAGSLIAAMKSIQMWFPALRLTTGHMATG